LVPVSAIDTAPLLLVVSPALPTVTVAELALSVNDTDAGLFVALEIVTAVLVSVRVTAAVVFNDIVPAAVVRLPIEPAPADVFTRLNVPDVVSAPDVCVIVPVPVDVSVICALLVLMVPANTIDELVPVSVRDTTVPLPLVVVASPPELTVMVAELALSVRAIDAGLFVALDEMDTAVLVSVTVTADVVLSEMTPADVVRLPIELPLPVVFTRLNVPDVVSAPAV
jgi:hypothetical protein